MRRARRGDGSGRTHLRPGVVALRLVVLDCRLPARGRRALRWRRARGRADDCRRHLVEARRRRRLGGTSLSARRRCPIAGQERLLPVGASAHHDVAGKEALVLPAPFFLLKRIDTCRTAVLIENWRGRRDGVNLCLLPAPFVEDAKTILVVAQAIGIGCCRFALAQGRGPCRRCRPPRYDDDREKAERQAPP